jgi:hypothetical protein
MLVRVSCCSLWDAEHPQKPKICICSWYPILESRAFLEVSSLLYYEIPDQPRLRPCVVLGQTDINRESSPSRSNVNSFSFNKLDLSILNICRTNISETKSMRSSNKYQYPYRYLLSFRDLLEPFVCDFKCRWNRHS